MPFLAIVKWISSSSSNLTGLRYSHEADSRGQPILFPSHSVATLVPNDRRNSCSADSINTKNRAKWTMPAMSVSENSIRRLVRYSCGMVESFEFPIEMENTDLFSHSYTQLPCCFLCDFRPRLKREDLLIVGVGIVVTT